MGTTVLLTVCFQDSSDIPHMASDIRLPMGHTLDESCILVTPTGMLDIPLPALQKGQSGKGQCEEISYSLFRGHKCS